MVEYGHAVDAVPNCALSAGSARGPEGLAYAYGGANGPVGPVKPVGPIGAIGPDGKAYEEAGPAI